jgi:hypothetical protein
MTVSIDNSPQIYSTAKNPYIENRTIQTGGRNIIIEKYSELIPIEYKSEKYFKTNLENHIDNEETKRMFNWGKLHNSMKFAFAKKQDLFNSNKLELIKNNFNFISSKITILPFEKCSVEITSDIFLKISLSFSNDRILILSKDLDSDFNQNLQDENILYSFFINRTLISTDAISLKLLSENFKKYITS